MKVNALQIRRVEDEGRGRSSEKKRKERRLVTSGETHRFEGIYGAAIGKRCLLFKNKSQVISKGIVQKPYFQQHYSNNTKHRYPTTCFFFFLNTDIQCLNTKHWCLKLVTKLALEFES